MPKPKDGMVAPVLSFEVVPEAILIVCWEWTKILVICCARAAALKRDLFESIVEEGKAKVRSQKQYIPLRTVVSTMRSPVGIIAWVVDVTSLRRKIIRIFLRHCRSLGIPRLDDQKE